MAKGALPTHLRYNHGMTWIYLSPHFDDVALSCGGLVWEQVQGGERVSIWTICGGDPPTGELSPFAQQLHNRWDLGVNASERRKIEDIHSSQVLGAAYRHFTIPDCIYRRHPQTGEYMYASEQSLNSLLDPGDNWLIQNLVKEIQRSLKIDATLVCPLTLGNHVDHQLTRQAAEATGYPLWYYADFPYVLNCDLEAELGKSEGWVESIFPISPPGLAAWQRSIAAHASQISTFWPDEAEMQRVVSDYADKNKGVRLWRKAAR